MPHRWNEFAETRRRQIETGIDLTFNRVFTPYFKALFQRMQPATVLEIGAGTGHLARRLAPAVRQYVAIEPSPGMCRQAHTVLADTSVRLSEDSLESYAGKACFDLVFSHMCLHVVEDLDHFLTLLEARLGPTGRFSLSLPHPAFYNDYKKFIAPGDYRYLTERRVSASFSISLDPGARIEGVPYHHRPLSRYFSALNSAGLCVTELDEISPSADIESLYGKPWEFPRYLVLGGARETRERA